MTDKCREALAELVALEDADINQRDPSWHDAWAAASAALAQPAEPAHSQNTHSLQTPNRQILATEGALWYVLDRNGLATLCKDKEDAEMLAAHCDVDYPRGGPYRAVQLVEAQPSEKAEFQGGLSNDELRAALESKLGRAALVTHHQVNREWEPYETVAKTHPIEPIKLKAADLIERQAAEIEALRNTAPLCDKHKPNGGKRTGCLVCAGIELQAALSKISYLCGEPNEMECGPYDVHYSETAVVNQVESLRAEMDALKADAERYRWLRENWVQYSPTVELHPGDLPFRARRSKLDAAIDSARSVEKSNAAGRACSTDR